jgi:hypothetical protein
VEFESRVRTITSLYQTLLAGFFQIHSMSVLAIQIGTCPRQDGQSGISKGICTFYKMGWICGGTTKEKLNGLHIRGGTKPKRPWSMQFYQVNVTGPLIDPSKQECSHFLR